MGNEKNLKPGEPLRLYEAENIYWSIENKKLTITMDLSGKGRPSESGKSILIATSRGAMPLSEGLMLNLNLYRKVNT